MLNNLSEVTIGNQTYQFHNRINTEPELLADFNRLAKATFDIQFQSVGSDYEPYVLTDGRTVCANVSVNQIPFRDNGKRRFYIQLGTVMTRKAYRNLGLCRWLMEAVIAEWKDRCDAIYLFANDSVLDFYPKFGFEPLAEYEYALKEPGISTFGCKKLAMEDSNHVNLVFEKYREGNCFSSLCLIENQSIFDFYATGICKDNIYYLEKQNVIVFAEFEAGKVDCLDIFGETAAELEDILGSLKQDAGDEVVLGFTPKNCDGLICREHKEEDTTLFVNGCGKNLLELGKRMFPVISHA